MNSTTSDGNSTNVTMGLVGDTHGSLYKIIGVTLAIASGIFIGSSFVLKKKGLLEATEKSGGVAGEGYGYLKSPMWWSGMILMVVGEACNFVAYAFTQAILVTPLGALSVVLCAVLSSIFLKERLSFQGKVGCLQCVLGAIIIVMHAPEQGAADTSIETFKTLMLSVGFITYAILAIVLSLFLVFYCGPRWGKTNMLVYISICSLIGSLSVVFTQGLGGAIVHSFTVENQFTNWFVYFVLVTTLVTLAIEIIYLNKALNLFNTAVVTPTYYVIFTTLTIVSSIVFYRGFDASPVNIVTCVFGFLIICSGVALLQNSRSEKTMDNDDASSHMERLLPVYDDEKFLSSSEDVNHIEDITGDASTSDVDHHRTSAVRNDSSSLWRRSRGSIDYNDGFTDNISLDTIKHSNSAQNSVDILVENGQDNIKSRTNNLNRRAQDTLDTISTMRLGLNKKRDQDDRRGLIGETDDHLF
ncbi:magnesium transporter NIPA-domain-containing protein [Mucor mucedo]|uniref:magnesium transporter NIPA-domain-containing protein n=1 Tax=Mucor mucedo TaxID=29922 RepID=UPI00221FF926|nr:magnesium transporter NIPA-domain-containing protein [Mucor mucedo]KAI7889216.1 magnesium transporter NIPA-domain-containing protein [Mucor mucedo]